MRLPHCQRNGFWGHCEPIEARQSHLSNNPVIEDLIYTK